MDRNKKLDQWWESLDDSEREQLRARGRLTAGQRADLVRAGLLRDPKPQDDDEGDLIAELKSRH